MCIYINKRKITGEQTNFVKEELQMSTRDNHLSAEEIGQCECWPLSKIQVKKKKGTTYID